MSIGDVYRLTVEAHWANPGIQLNNVLWFQQTAEPPVVDESLFLAQDFITNVRHLYRNEFVQTGNLVYDDVRCQKMLFTFESPALAPWVMGQTGQRATLGAPSVCCYVVTLRTGLQGRENRGRLFLGGFQSDRFLNPGQWDGLIDAGVQSYMQSILNRYGTGNVAQKFQWGVWSPKRGHKTPPFAVQGFRAITSFDSDNIVRVQRRREFGVGA